MFQFVPTASYPIKFYHYLLCLLGLLPGYDVLVLVAINKSLISGGSLEQQN